MLVIDKHAVEKLENRLKTVINTTISTDREDNILLAINAAVFIVNIQDFSLASDEVIEHMLVGKSPKIVLEKALNIINIYQKKEIDAILEALLKEAILTQQGLEDRLSA